MSRRRGSKEGDLHEQTSAPAARSPSTFIALESRLCELPLWGQWSRAGPEAGAKPCGALVLQRGGRGELTPASGAAIPDPSLAPPPLAKPQWQIFTLSSPAPYHVTPPPSVIPISLHGDQTPLKAEPP